MDARSSIKTLALSGPRRRPRRLQAWQVDSPSCSEAPGSWRVHQGARAAITRHHRYSLASGGRKSKFKVWA